MTEIKRTIETPPSGLQKKVLELSVTQDWNEALKEWKMKNYYYVLEHKSCPCSPREIHNISVLVNKFNSNELEICNSCSERYFNIEESGKIESDVRKLKSKITLRMNLRTLDYLMRHKVINFVEHENYWMAIRCHNYSVFRNTKKEINIRLINFTDYRNKEAFDKIDIILAWANEHTRWPLGYLASARMNLLSTGLTDMEYLNRVIDEKKINGEKYGYKERKAGMQLLWRFFRSISIKCTLPAKHRKKHDFLYKEIASNNGDIQENISFEINQKTIQNEDDNSEKLISLYMKEDTLQLIAEGFYGWGNQLGVDVDSIYKFILFLGIKEISYIFYSNYRNIEEYSDFINLLSMADVKKIFCKLMSKTKEEKIQKVAIKALNTIFKEENIIVEYDGWYLYFRNTVDE